MTNQRNLRRPLLYTLVGSVILAALLGIVLVLRNQWGWFEIRVILTTIIIAIASVCGLACDLSRTPRGANRLVSVGLLLTIVAAVMIIVGMWFAINSESYWKVAAISSVLAVATVHVCLLSIARLAARFGWVFMVTCQVVYGLAVMLSAMILEFNSEPMYRLVAIVAIADAALTIVIPILHRISKTDTDSTVMTTLDERNVDAIDYELAVLKKRIAVLEQLRNELVGSADDVG